MTPSRKSPDLTTYSGRCAARLTTLRERAGLSHAELADLLGVQWRTIYNWESGTTEPKQDALVVLAEAFHLKSPRMVLAEK